MPWNRCQHCRGALTGSGCPGKSPQSRKQQDAVGQQQPTCTDVTEADSRVLDVQAGPIREVDAEGHRGGSADDGSPILLL